MCMILPELYSTTAYFFIFILTYSWAINWLINVHNGCYTLLLHEKQHVSMHDRTLLVSYISPDVSRYIKNAFFHMFANVAHKTANAYLQSILGICVPYSYILFFLKCPICLLKMIFNVIFYKNIYSYVWKYIWYITLQGW